MVLGYGLSATWAAAQCDAAAVEQVRIAHNREADRAATWNLAWAVAYGVFAAGQVGLAVAEYAPGRTWDHAAAAAMYTGAGKATIGMATRLILPLRLPRVAASGDPCVDAAALRRAHAIAARKERNAFWLQLGGGLALHAAVGTYLVVGEDSWRDAITSFAIGAVASAVTLYTLPKRSWWSAQPAAIVPTTGDGSLGLAVVGSF